MAGMKSKHCSKVCETTHEMTKHLSTYKMQQGMTRRTVLHDTLYKTNGSSMAKVEAMLSLVKLISKEESLYINALNKRDLALD